MKQGRSPEDFYNQTVKPAVFDCLDTVFPDFRFEKKGKGWKATNREHTKSWMNVRPDRVTCDTPGVFMVAGGDSCSWVEYLHGSKPKGKGFVDCVKRLAEKAGIDTSPIERPETPEQREKRTKQERLGSLLEYFSEAANGTLCSEGGKVSRSAMGYLEGRGFNKKDMSALPFGVFTEKGKVRDACLKKGYTEEEISTSGLLADPRWEGRLLIFARDERGKLATISARTLEGSEQGDKYLYLKGHSKPLAFGLDKALKNNREELVVVEGIIDPIYMETVGVKNVISVGGRLDLLSEKKLAALSGLGVKRLVLFSDNDKQGREGLANVIKKAKPCENVPVLYVVNPEGLGKHKDPDELTRQKGPEAFQDLVRTSVHSSGYELTLLLKDISPNSPDKEKRLVVEKVLALMDQTSDKLSRDHLAQRLSSSTGYSESVLSRMIEEEEEKHRRGLAAKQIERAASQAQNELKEGQPVEDVSRKLLDEVSSVSGSIKTPPPVFSVDRLQAESAATPNGLLSGWRPLDNLGVVFNPQEFALIGARTGHGKTSALIGLLWNWINNGNVSDNIYLLYSHEEPEVRIFHRLLALATVLGESEEGGRWTSREILQYYRGETRDSWPEVGSLQLAEQTLKDLESRIQIIHEPSWTVEQLAAHAKSVEAKVGGIFVDYLQRVPSSPDSTNGQQRRDQEVSHIGRQLKALSVDLSCPVVAGCQVNRMKAGFGEAGGPFEDSKDKIRRGRPELHNLREGGCEQEADLVLGLLNYAADYTGEDSLPEGTLFEVGVLKNRYGTVGRWVELELVGKYGLIKQEQDWSFC
jgi:DNA primase catalytic core